MNWININKRKPTLENVCDHEMGGTSDFALVFAKGVSAIPEMALFNIDKHGNVTWDICNDVDGDMDWFVITHWMLIDPPGDDE